MDLASPTIIKQGNNYSVSHGDDSSLFVEFKSVPKKNELKSAEAGREVWEMRDYVTIRFAGDKNTVVEERVKENSEWPLRFPRQWQAYKNQQVQVADGMPITEWALINKAEAMELKAINIHTVEALAAVSDSNLKWLGARVLRDKAIAWLEQANNGAGLAKMQAENEDLKIQIEALRNEIKALAQHKGRKNVKDVIETDSSSIE